MTSRGILCPQIAFRAPRCYFVPPDGELVGYLELKVSALLAICGVRCRHHHLGSVKAPKLDACKHKWHNCQGLPTLCAKWYRAHELQLMQKC